MDGSKGKALVVQFLFFHNCNLRIGTVAVIWDRKG